MAHPERNSGDERIESCPDEKDGRDEIIEQDGTKGTNSSKSWRGNAILSSSLSFLKSSMFLN